MARRYCQACPIAGKCQWRAMCVPLEGTRVGRFLDSTDSERIQGIFYPWAAAVYFAYLGYAIGGWWWLGFGPVVFVIVVIAITMTRQEFKPRTRPGGERHG